MISPSLRSDDGERLSAKRQSSELSDTETTSEAESGSESEYNGGRSSVRRLRRKTTAASSIAAKVVRRRRAAGRSKVNAHQRQASKPKAVTPPTTTTTTSPEGSEASTGVDEEEGCEDEDSAGSSPARVLKWKDIPYPGLPVRGGSLFVHFSFFPWYGTYKMLIFPP